MLKNNTAYCWASDYSTITGEGNLARLFVKKNIKTKIKIYGPKGIFQHKYISPFVGIFYCWYFFFKRKKNYYLNYLPLWNFFLFIFLPPSTNFGPITGGAEYNKKKTSIIRKKIFPLFYRISEIFLIIRNKKNYFSTDLLEKHLWKKSKKNNFNYVYNFFSKKIKIKKDIDLLIYYRKHPNKISDFPYGWVKQLIALGAIVHIVGDRLSFAGVKNHGYVNSTKISLLQSKSRFSLASNENIFSIFTIECINNHAKIFINKSNKKKIAYKNCFIFTDYAKHPLLKYFK